jgi:hypothetical protein
MNTRSSLAGKHTDGVNVLTSRVFACAGVITAMAEPAATFFGAAAVYTFVSVTVTPGTTAAGSTGGSTVVVESTVVLGADPPVDPPVLGAAGVAAGVASTAALAAPRPTEFRALIWTEYVVPFVRPVITIGDVVVPAEVKLEPPSVDTS